MQSEIVERLKSNQEELSRLRLKNAEKPFGDLSFGNPLKQVKLTHEVHVPLKEHEDDLFLQFNSLKSEYLKTGKSSKRVLDEFKKLEREVLQLEGKNIADEDDDEELLEIKRRHAKEMLLIRHQKELLLQKLELQKLVQEIGSVKSNIILPDLITPDATAATTLPAINSASCNQLPQISQLPALVNSERENQVNRNVEMDYTVENGFFGFIDSIIGLPKYLDGYHVTCTFGVFEGAESRGDLHFISGKKNLEGLAMLQKSFSLDVLPIRNFRLLLEFRAQDPKSRNARDVVLMGWTCIDLFNDKFQPDYGKWLLPLFRPPLDFNISTNHLYTTGQIVTGLNVVIYLLDKIKRFFNGNNLPCDEKGTADLKKYPFAVKGLEYYANGERPRRKLVQKRDQINLNVKTGQNIVQSAISTSRNLKDLVHELINMELNSDKKLKKAWKAGESSSVKKAGIGFQVEEIRNLLPTVSLPKIRFRFAEVFEEVVEFDSEPHHTILTEEAEPGIDDSSYGFPSQAFIELHDLALGPFKRVFIEILDGAAIVGSAELQLCKENGTSAELNEGHHTLSLMRQSALDSDGNSANQATLSMKIYNPINGRPDDFKFASKVGTKPIPEGAWISVINNPPSGRENHFRPGDGIAIFVDAARFLPVNVGPTRVFFRILNNSRKVSRADYQTKLDLEDALCNPEYKFATIFQNYNLDTTSILALKIFTLLEDGSKAMVGYSSLPLLLPDSESKKERKDNFFVNEGGHQIPLLLSASPTEKLRLPCSSLLIRLLRVPASQMQDFNILSQQPLPRYSDRIYDSSRCVPHVYEERLYYYVFTEQKVVQVKERLKGKQNIQSISKKLPNNFDDEAPIIDRSFIVTYDSNAGFRISVDTALNYNSKFPTFAAISLLSTSAKSDSDTKFNTKVDYNSGVKSPKWLDGYHWYRWSKFDPNMFILIQLVQINVAEETIIVDGWTVIPIFNGGSNYVSLGNFQLPIIPGQCSRRMIEMMKKNGVDEGLIDLIEMGEISLSKGRLNMRLCDGRRMEELPTDAPVELNEISLLLDLRLNNKISSSSSINSLIPKSSNRTEFESKTFKIFNANLGSVNPE